MLDSKTAFKVAFLKKCAEEGLTLEETHEVVKQALSRSKTAALSDLAVKPYNVLWDIAKNVGGKLGTVGLTAAIAGPPILGYAAGATIPKLTDVEDQDVREMKQRQLIEEYHRLSRDMEQKRKQQL